MDGMKRNSEFIKNITRSNSNSYGPLKILDTSIPTLIWGDPTGTKKEKEKIAESFKESIKKAVENGTSIQILLLHPNSFVAIQRARDQDKTPYEYLSGMSKTLAFLYKIGGEILEEKQNKHKMNFNTIPTLQDIFEIKLYDKLPSVSAYAFADYIYAGFFPHNKPCDQGTTIKILRSTALGEYVIKQFDSLWNDAGTINLVDFMKLQLAINGKREDETAFYLPRVANNTTLVAALRPTHIAVSKPHNLHFFDKLKNNPAITLSRKRAGKHKPDVPDKFDKIDAIIESELSSDNQEWTNTTHQLVQKYGCDFQMDNTGIYRLDQIGAEIEDIGWAHRTRAQINAPLIGCAEFSKSWDHLKDDNYIPGFPIKTQRRIAKYYLEGDLYWLSQDGNYHQCNQNCLFIDTTRSFTIADKEIALNPKLKMFLLGNLRRMIANTADAKHPCWRIILHQIRVYPCSGDGGSPAPEGIHQDGHDYVSIHLINKVNVEGADSMIYIPPTNSSPIIKTLSQPFDSLFLNDRKVLHAVSKLKIKNGFQEKDAYRDTLLIGYEKTVNHNLNNNNIGAVRV
jgi:hypothetical protein